MTDAEAEDLREQMREQRGELRDYLEGVDVSGWTDPADGVADADIERDTADSD